MWRPVTTLAALAAAGAAGVLAAPAAQAVAGPDATLTLTAHAKGEAPKEVTLHCHAAGGSHPRPASACDSLDRVDGDFSRLRSTGEACTMQYQQVTVSATGSWSGTPVDYRETFGNPCQAATETDRVFAF